MKKRPLRILIFDLDQDTLIRLEQLLEDSGLYTTTTWEPTEARRLLESRYFDLLVVGHHPPELDAARLLSDLQKPERSSACVLLSTATRSEIENFRSMGAGVVIPRRDHLGIVEEVQKYLYPLRAERRGSASFEQAS